VRFLIEPGSASKASRPGYRVLRADQDQSLHPALRSVLEGQPEFASWTPSSLCFFYVDTVTVGGRVIAEKNARKPQMIAVWTLPTVAQGRGVRHDLVLEFSAGSPQVVRAAEAVKLRMREASSRISLSADSTEEVQGHGANPGVLVTQGGLRHGLECQHEAPAEVEPGIGRLAQGGREG
jgi:hypothetical protein